ncbi:MAG: YraN family protein [Candidatus Accumulibacter sp.]|nr:YraN family protein [Accumulibacter sp.]
MKWIDKDNTSRSPAPPETGQSGRLAEDLAARFLTCNGVRIVARNYRCRGGEIDLVCRDGRTLVFVEVRFRHRASHGGAIASITAGKRHRLLLAARHYLASHALTGTDCRFDCLLLDQLSENAIEWLRNAFDAT